MNFLYPGVLLALLVPAALLVWVWRGERRRLVLPFDYGRPGRGLGWRIILGVAESLPPLLLAVVIVLLAGPQQLGEPKEKRVLTNIELCLDVSGSMTAPFGDGTRYDAAMKEAEAFCSYRKGDAFGLTFFGNNYLHWCPLTSDVSAIKCSPPFMRPENLPPGFGGTEIGKALRACRKVLAERQEGDRMIILISDGESFDLHGGNAEAIARELKNDHITVFAVIIGMDRIQDEIVTITATTGGEAFLAGDPEALTAVFRRI
ncbi:MAG TPA: vWA domain-containing protein, partial [Gemmataceae bacterium]|nr:vWA domain-containing protein [Gemmataceae bacterium]